MLSRRCSSPSQGAEAFTHAVRYGYGELEARESVFVSAVLAVPVILAVVALLG